MYHEIAGTLVLIAAVPRKECVKLPASRAACRFKKRPAKPRMSKTVNKGIRGTTSGRSSYSSTTASRRCAVQQDEARRWHTHAAGPKRRQQLSIAERFILKAGCRSGALNMV
jgi:hypothetical protein